jgi:hypothetical protein
MEVQDLYDGLVGSCWACDLLDQFTAIGLGLADQVFAAICGQISALLGLLLGVWIVLFAGRCLLPFGPDQDPGALWNQGAKKLFRVAIVLAILHSSEAFWDYVFMPIISAGVGLAAVLSASATATACPATTVGWGVQGAQAAMKSMDCILGTIQEGFAKGLLVGVAMTAGAGGHSWIDFLKVWELPGQILQTLSGLVLAGVYAFGFLVYPLLFIDALVRATVVSVFAPLALAASLFVPTAKLAGNAMWNLVQSAFTMVVASVIVAIASATQTYVYGTLPTANGTGVADWRSLIVALDSGTLKLSLIDQTYWTLLALGVLVIFMLRRAAGIAAQFTGASGGDFSGATGAIAAVAGRSAQAVAELGRRVAQKRAAAPIVRPAQGRTRPARRPARKRASIAERVARLMTTRAADPRARQEDAAPAGPEAEQ